MQSRRLTQRSILAGVRVAAMFFLGIFPVLGFVGTARATGGIPWQVGDVVVCYGGGNCNVLRIQGTSVQLLDTLCDTTLACSGGNTSGVALNNSLHLLVTDNGGGGSSKVVVYSIASINPFKGTQLSHSVISTYNASGGTGSSNAQAVALNSAGHIFVGNAGNGGGSPSIVELNAHGSPTGHVFTFPTTTNDPCAPTTLGSLDIGATGDAIYVTAKDGVIRKVSLASGSLSGSSSCTVFANFGSGVHLYGIKDIPAGALTGNCTASVSCPPGETVLVVATGFTDPDAVGNEPPSPSDPDAINICTNVADTTPVSCALLLDTNPNPGSLWQAGTQYFALGAPALDPYLHQQTVVTAGTSGADEPAFSAFGEPVPVIDNAVIWTDQGQPAWAADKPYAPAAFPGSHIVDSNLDLQTVTTTGISGHIQPIWQQTLGQTTIDGLQWTDQGQSVWNPNTHYFTLNAFISDPSTHAQKVIQAGTSALAGAQPAAGWSDGGGNTIEGVTWTESHPTWAAASLYAKSAVILDSNNHVQQVSQAGTAGTNPPAFQEGSTTDDNTVTWMDEGQQFWQANNTYAQNAIIVDAAGHVQEAAQTGNGTSGPTQPKLSDSAGPAIPDGLVWTDQGAPLSNGWQPDSSFDLHQIIVDNNNPAHFQQVVVAGSSGSPIPVFSTAGGYTLDQAFLIPPAPPQTSYGTGGSVTSDTTYYVVITYVNPYGETTPSGEVTQFVPAGSLLTVISPTAAGAGADTATGYNVYVSTSTTGASGAETKQTATPQPIGVNWTENAGGLSAGTAVPATNTTVHSVVWIDLGQTASWAPTTSYPLNAVVKDLTGHVQQATQAGKSGSETQPLPTWNDCTLQTTPPGLNTCTNTVTTLDNVVLWTDEGLVGSNPAFIWQKNTPYAPAVMIVDGASHVQEAMQRGSGTSSPSQPTFVDSGTVNDNTVTWTDEGQEFWQANNVYSPNALIVDAAGHVQATTQTGNGTSGPTQPVFSDSNGPAIPDGLVWTDQGKPLGPWQANQAYTLSQIILDNNTHFQRVAVAGTSGAGPSLPAFSTSGGTTLDNTVVWLDLGQKVSWTPTSSYPLNAVVTDLSGHVQQATQAGKSGSGTQPAPAWNDCALSGSNTCTSTATTNDNVVLWTDEGTVGSNPTFTWASNTLYAQGTMIVDAAHHVQQATQAGTGLSGASPGPAFVDGGTVIDGLIWADQGQPAWLPNIPYSQTGTFIVDTHNNLATVLVPGISGPGTPLWQPSGMTIDGLIWTDQGAWMANKQYFTLGTAVGEAAGHVHTVLTTGTSSASGTQPASGWKDDGTTTIDNAVMWTESHPKWAANHGYVKGNSDTLILDDAHSHVQLVSTSGTSGPSTPPFTSDKPITGQTIDGLQWSNQATPATSVAARYPVTGVMNTLQSLALDPLVADCTGSAGTACANRIPSGTNRKVGNFWLGDSGSGTFYKLDFKTGTPITLTPGCTSCGIQSILVYGGEGSNQPGLASLVSASTLNSGNLFTARAQFLHNTITSTLSNNGIGSPPPTLISLFASLVDKTSCFNDPLAGNLPCRATVSADTTKALVWKLDVPLNGTAGLPLGETLNTSFGPPGVFGVDNSTDVFVDEQFDDTTFVGTDPGTRTISVHSLHEVLSFSQTQAHCKYSNPLQNGCYKTNRGTLNFIFTCPGLSPTQFQHMHPSLSLVKKNPPQAPKFIPLSGTNGKAPYRFDSSGNFWTFQWNLNGATAGTYEGTTFDSPGVDDNPSVQSFPVTFSLKNSCP
jgi:hypothetical protein